ncbi:hypothetical protein [Chitinophaga dinghuensis]|nr:hypothetical protein [Chitinophaga dinghuensis]
MKSIILSLLLATGILHTYAQTDAHVASTNLTENTTGRNIRKLLIISTGPMSSRKIAQDLKYAFDKEFKNHDLTTSLVHLGDISYFTDENIQIASKMYPHDAILVINPQLVSDSTRDYVHRTLAHNLFLRNRGLPVRQKRTKEFSTQTSIFSLLDDANITVPFWSAQMEVATNLASDKYFDHLVKTLKDTWLSQMISLGS